MSINPLLFNSNTNQNKTPANQSAGNSEFAKALEKANTTKEQDEFLVGLSDNFEARLAYYKNTCSSEEHETYIKMMEYFKEKNSLY